MGGIFSSDFVQGLLVRFGLVRSEGTERTADLSETDNDKVRSDKNKVHASTSGANKAASAESAATGAPPAAVDLRSAAAMSDCNRTDSGDSSSGEKGVQVWSQRQQALRQADSLQNKSLDSVGLADLIRQQAADEDDQVKGQSSAFVLACFSLCLFPPNLAAQAYIFICLYMQAYF